MNNLKDFLETMITTGNVGSPSNYVGTRKKRFGDEYDDFITGTPKGMEGLKKKKQKKSIKKSKFGHIIQQRPAPFNGAGKYIMLPEDK